MAAADDWMEEAADDIAGKDLNCFAIVEVIARHSPFKDGVAYMPVPRCDTCAHWRPDRSLMTGDCHLINDNCGGNSILETDADFGCVQWQEKKGDT